MGLSGLPISKGGRLTGASSSTSNTTPPGVCGSVCWGPELWLFLPELGIRKQLCPLSWHPGTWTWVGIHPPDAALYGRTWGQGD